jgi:hypothetical protein
MNLFSIEFLVTVLAAKQIPPSHDQARCTKGKKMVIVIHMLYDRAAKARKRMHPRERTYVQRRWGPMCARVRTRIFKARRLIEQDRLCPGRNIGGAGDTNNVEICHGMRERLRMK